MSRSMTAYSRVSSPSSLGTFILELHSVNRKGLDISLHLPRELLRFDVELRKQLSGCLERGQVTLRFSFQADTIKTAFYLSELGRIKREWEAICEELGWSKLSVDLPFACSQLPSATGLCSKEEEESFRLSLRDALDRALQELVCMKTVEGEVLARDIQDRLFSIEESLVRVASRREAPLLSYRKKIEERLQEWKDVMPELKERIEKEVALMAEKMDVAEEIVRLRAHIAQIRIHLSSTQKSVGRTLDFLAQEMHREINTLGSKSQDGEIALSVIQMKSELDRIREQVQNIE